MKRSTHFLWTLLLFCSGLVAQEPKVLAQEPGVSALELATPEKSQPLRGRTFSALESTKQAGKLGDLAVDFSKAVDVVKPKRTV